MNPYRMPGVRPSYPDEDPKPSPTPIVWSTRNVSTQLQVDNIMRILQPKMTTPYEAHVTFDEYRLELMSWPAFREVARWSELNHHIDWVGFKIFVEPRGFEPQAAQWPCELGQKVTLPTPQ